MKKAIFIVTILFVAVISTACINNMAVQELNSTAKSYIDKGDYNSAIERLESSLELDGNVYETHYNLGVAYINVKQYKKAIDELTKAVKLNSKYANTYYTLAVAQESYADSLVETEAGEITPDEDSNQPYDTYKNVADNTKEEMIEWYLAAITNYRKYTDIINSAQKTEEINSHITDMGKVLEKLGYKGSEY